MLLLQDALDVFRSDSDEVDLVGQPLAGLDRGDVRVHQHREDPFLLHRLQGLGARIVEFARLPDLEGPGAEQEHLGRQRSHGGELGRQPGLECRVHDEQGRADHHRDQAQQHDGALLGEGPRRAGVEP